MDQDYTLEDIVHISQIVDGFKILVRNQRLNLDKEHPKISDMVNKLINSHPDIGTILNLPELWSNASNTRASGIPRPQNSFILYRKDISKGLLKAIGSMPVCDSSRFASFKWKSLNKYEKRFWNQLFEIVKVKHSIDYPNYKFRPNRNKMWKQKKRYYDNDNDNEREIEINRETIKSETNANESN